MPRNGSGTYTLPEAAFVPGTTIVAAQVNNDFSDIATAITGSVASDGQTTITGPLKASSGHVGAPGYTFAGDLDTGIYRPTANQVGITVGGSGVILVESSIITITPDVTISGDIDGTDADLSGVLTLSGTSHMVLPSGTTGQRPGTPGAANLRYNSTTSEVEFYNGILWQALTPPALPRGYIDGCLIANGTDATNDINFAGGECRDGLDTADIVVAAMTKRLDANWVAGTNQGMRNSVQNGGSISNGTYHLYAVSTATGTQDFYAYFGSGGFNPDSAANIATVLTALQAEPSGSDYIFARRVASIMRAGGSIVPFIQVDDDFIWSPTIVSAAGSSFVGVSPFNQGVAVPNGLEAACIFNVALLTGGTGGIVLLCESPLVTSSAADLSASANATCFGDTTSGIFVAASQRAITNRSSEIRMRVSSISGTPGYRLSTVGYVDFRGTDVD
jgi:hypothetical protein